MREMNTPAIGTDDPIMCYRRGFEQELGETFRAIAVS